MPESIRNAIVLALIAVLVAVTGVGLLAWTRRPAAPPAGPARGLPLLVTDRDDSIYDLSLKLRQMERRQADGQVTSQKLMEQLLKSNEERAHLTSRLTGLEKEVRNLRKRLQDAEQRLAPREPAQTTTPETLPPSLPGSPPPATSTDSPPTTSP